MRLRDWAFGGYSNKFDNALRVLATRELLPEKWSYAGNDDLGILKNYLNFTFGKLWDEREAALDADKQEHIYISDTAACFNTGLYDNTWQPIYFYCEPNSREGFQPFVFHSFYNSYTIKNTKIPAESASKLRKANYFDTPDKLIFNLRLPIIPQWQHILHDEENFLRIPESIRSSGKTYCQRSIDGAISFVRKQIDSNYKIAVPQFYKGKIQLLAPLYLTNDQKPDLALVLSLSEDGAAYYGHTCITPEMAYNNARLIARPESSWLQP